MGIYSLITSPSAVLNLLIHYLNIATSRVCPCCRPAAGQLAKIQLPIYTKKSKLVHVK